MNKKLFWIFSLSSAVYFTQGIENLPSQSLFYYLKDTLHYSPEKIMVITSITIFAWLIKPLIGFVIDNYFNKKIWIFISLGFDIVLVWLIGTFSFPIAILVAILILNSNNAAFRDVAVDGIMCVEGKKYDATGRIQSVQWISVSVAGMLAGIGGGYIAEKLGYKEAYLMLIPVYIIVGLVTYFYKEDDYHWLRNTSTFFEDLKKIFADKRMWVVIVFIFLYKYSPSFGTPLFFVQRDTFKWSKIWIGWLTAISTLFGVAGSLLYYKVSRKINIQKWLFISVFLGAVTSLCYLYYTPVTAVIYDTTFNLIGMFIFIMVLDLMAKKSVQGLEATSFALLCSVSNLALVASNLSGAWLLPLVGLKWLIIISSLTSFLCLPLINKIK